MFDMVSGKRKGKKEGNSKRRRGQMYLFLSGVCEVMSCAADDEQKLDRKGK